MRKTIIAALSLLASLPLLANAEELKIPGALTRGEPVFEKTRFGQGLRIEQMYDALNYGVANLRPEEGSVEIWFKPTEEVEAGKGRTWRNLMTAPPLASQAGKYHTQLTLCITEDTGAVYKPCALAFSLKTEKENTITTESLTWPAGRERHVAATWGKRGTELFVDGKLVARNPKVLETYLDKSPERLTFGGHPMMAGLMAKGVIDEIKVSDIQRDKDYIEKSFQRDVAPQMDGNTLLLAHLDGSLDAKGRLTEWKRSQNICAIQNAWQAQLGPEQDQGNIFLSGEEPELRVYASRFAKAQEAVAIDYRIIDVKGVAVQTGDRMVMLSARCEKMELVIPLEKGLPPGFYKAEIALKGSQGVIANSTQNLCVLDGELPESDFLWGFNIYDDWISSFPAMRKMGIRLLRGHGVYFWPAVEPRKGEWNWKNAKFFSERSEKYGMRVLGVLGNTPAWANVPPDNAKDFEGGKNHAKMLKWRERYRPREIAEWREYVSKTVAENPQVKYWEIWNEPDWHLPQTIGFGFGGTTAQYFELMKAAYEAAKKANPNCVVVFPGIAGAAVADPNFASALIKMGCLKYFDLLGMHPYGGIQFFLEQVALFRTAGYKGPLWQSEYVPDAFLSEPFPTRGKALARLQTQHIVRMLPLGLSAYVIHSGDIYFPYGQPNEACFAFGLLFRQVAGLEFIRKLQSDAFLFGGKDRTLLILWGKKPVDLAGCGASKLKLTDLMGFTRELEAKDGKASFIPGDLLYVEAADGGRLNASTLEIDAAIPSLPLNASFEEFDGDAGFGNFTPLNWELSSAHRDGKLNIDLNASKGGKASLLLERAPEMEEKGKMAVFQMLPPLPKGGRLTLSAWIKAEIPEGRKGAAMVTVWDRERAKLYGSLSVTTTKNSFELLSGKVEIPADASDKICIGCSIEGGMAKAWFDAISLKRID